MPEVVLGNSGAAGEWRLCVDGKCRTLSEILGHPIGRKYHNDECLRSVANCCIRATVISTK